MRNLWLMMRNVWKGENSRFYTILQVDDSAEEEEEEKKTVHDDEDMDMLSLELLPQWKKERKKHRKREKERERVKNCGSRYLNQYLGKSILDILNPIIVWGWSQYRCSCAEIRSIYCLPCFAQLVHCRLHWLCWMPSPSLQDLSPYSSLSVFVCLSQSITCIMEQTLYMGVSEIAHFHSFHKGFGALRFPLFHKSLGGKKKNAKNPARIIVYVVLLEEFCKLLCFLLLVQNSYELEILLLNSARK